MIKAIVQSKYGTERIYFAQKEHREIWEDITSTDSRKGKKTISMKEINGLKKLGLDIDVVNPLDMIEQ